MKKEKKVNIIISNKTNEINLTKSILYLIKSNKKNNNNNFDIFQKLKPEHKNILQYMPISYTGINNYGYMFINHSNHSNNSNSNSNLNNKNENEIHFFTNYFNDKNSQYILLFRKYILNLSCFRNNELNHEENEIMKKMIIIFII